MSDDVEAKPFRSRVKEKLAEAVGRLADAAKEFLSPEPQRAPIPIRPRRR